MRKLANSIIVFVLTLCPLLLIGCKEDTMGYVTGAITIDGKPASKGVVVQFLPENPGTSPSSGMTDANGAYEMSFTFAKKGVMIGPAQVMFSVDREGGQGSKVTLPRRYRDGFVHKVEVVKGGQKFDFDLRDE